MRGMPVPLPPLIPQLHYWVLHPKKTIILACIYTHVPILSHIYTHTRTNRFLQEIRHIVLKVLSVTLICAIIFTSLMTNWWRFVQLNHCYVFLGFHFTVPYHLWIIAFTRVELQFPVEIIYCYRVNAYSIA